MCRSKADGGRRCPSTRTGRQLTALYRQRRDNPSRRTEITEQIDRLKEAVSFYGGRFVTLHHIDIAPGVEDALTIARRAGNPLIVGGAVRDSLAGADSKDIDIEVYGTDIDTLVTEFRSGGFRVDEVGKQFGVLKVSKAGVVADLDVAVPRRENTAGAGHRGFDVSHDSDMTVVEAAARRDFTINSVSYDPARGVLVDPYGGNDDLDNGVLRHVGGQFAEDPLRVLRGFQFAGRFGLRFDQSTAKLCRGLRDRYAELSVERVREEWVKFFTKSTRLDLGVEALRASGWDDTVPGLSSSLTVDTVRRLRKVSTLPVVERPIIGAAIIAAAMPEKDVRELLTTVLTTKDDSRRATDLIRLNPDDLDTLYRRKTTARRLVRRGFNFRRYAEFAAVIGDASAQAVASSAIREGVGDGPELDWIQGRDVVASVTRKPGPWLGELLDEVRDRQYRGEFSDRDSALAWALEQAALTD